MADVLLFHHAQGLTEGVEAFAGELRSAGHSVTVPDLYARQSFATVQEGVAHAESIGFDRILRMADEIADRVPGPVVYGGFSLGALCAHRLAQTREGAAGALLYHHGDVPVTTFGAAWPGVDVQIHVNRDDPFCEPGVVQEFVEIAGRSASAELFLYDGSGHLFADPSLAEYAPESAALLMQRTLAFLEGRPGS